MHQVLREHEAGTTSEQTVWTELEGDALPGASQPRMSHPLQLPIWTDLVLPVTPQTVEPELEEALTLPRSIKWERMPESMVVKQIRLSCLPAPAGEIHAGMTCPLVITVYSNAPGQSDQAAQQGSNRQQTSQQLSVADWIVDAANERLTAELELGVQFEDDVVITTVGEQYGPGDIAYLASWGVGTASRADPVDADESLSFALSYHGPSGGDTCVLELLLAPATGGQQVHSLCQVTCCLMRITGMAYNDCICNDTIEALAADVSSKLMHALTAAWHLAQMQATAKPKLCCPASMCACCRQHQIR